MIWQDPFWNKLLWYCADNDSYKGCFLPEKLEIPQEDFGQANNWFQEYSGQANNWDDVGAQVNNWDCEGAEANDWDQDQVGKVNNWDQDQGGQVNNWDQDEGELAKNWNEEGTCVNEEKQSFQPSPDVEGTTHQTDYIPDPVMDEAEWSDGWK